MINKEMQIKLRERYNPDGSALRIHQMRMLDILVHIDRFCKDNGITYWLSSGTCLGAIRHNGFIPWDDDVDIEMMRNDYVKFVKLFKETDDYILQTCKNDAYYTLCFGKVRNKHTEIYDSLFKYRGVFVDVFCLEYTNRTLAHIAEKSRFIFSCLLYSKLKRCDKNSIKYYILNFLFFSSKKIYLALIPIFRLITKILPNNKLRHVYGAGWVNNIRNVSEILPTTTACFEGIDLQIPGNADAYLKRMYGEYMDIPLEDDIRPPHVQYFK